MFLFLFCIVGICLSMDDKIVNKVASVRFFCVSFMLCAYVSRASNIQYNNKSDVSLANYSLTSLTDREKTLSWSVFMCTFRCDPTQFATLNLFFTAFFFTGSDLPEKSFAIFIRWTIAPCNDRVNVEVCIYVVNGFISSVQPNGTQEKHGHI